MTLLPLILTNLLFALLVFFSYIISIDPLLSGLIPQFISFGIIVFILTSILSKKIASFSKFSKTITLLALTLVILLTVFTTGALMSSSFFLIYFLLFALSAFMGPSFSLTVATSISISLLLLPITDLGQELLRLSSLFMITPLALIFGSQYKKISQNETEIELLKNEESVLTKEVVNQESEVRTWTQEELKLRLAKIWENLEDVSREYSVSINAKAKLNEISNQLKNLLSSAEQMEKKVEK